MDEAACLKKLTTFSAHTIRKVPPLHHGDKPTWARAEIIEERLGQDEIVKEIKKLNGGKKTLTEKKTALAQFQQGQIATLLDDLASSDPDRGVFEYSLVQFDRKEKEVPTEKTQKRKYETITMTIFVKRAPADGINPIALYQNIERVRAERMRPPPQPQPRPDEHRDGHQADIIQILEDDHGGHKDGHGGRPRKLKSVKGHGKKNHHSRSSGSSSSSRSYDSDSYSEDSYSDSMDTSIESTSTEPKKSRRYNSRRRRSHSRHRESPVRYYLESGLPDRHPSAYGIPQQQQPYAPEAPRALPQPIAGPPAIDPITTAYQAGREDAIEERYGRRSPPPPPFIERVIERVIEPKPVISYGRPEPLRILDREVRDEERYRDELRREENEIRRRDAEDYIDRTRPLPARVNYLGGDFRPEPLRRTYPERRPEPAYYDNRRPIPTARSPPPPSPRGSPFPFAPTPISANRRRPYAPSIRSNSDSSGW